MADRARARWSEPLTAVAPPRLRTRQPRTPAQVLSYAAQLAAQLGQAPDANRLDREARRACGSCCRLLIGLLDVRHALKTRQPRLPAEAAAALRPLFAASAELAVREKPFSGLAVSCAYSASRCSARWSHRARCAASSRTLRTQ